jgi:hypothetical protein
MQLTCELGTEDTHDEPPEAYAVAQKEECASWTFSHKAIQYRISPKESERGLWVLARVICVNMFRHAIDDFGLAVKIMETC